MELNEQEQKVFVSRQKRYGTFVQAHKNLGLLWTGLIQNYFGIELSEPIPSHLVLLMMVASKLNRAAAEKGLLVDEENYDDGKIYLEMAKNAKKEFERLAKEMPEKAGKKRKPNSNLT